MNTIAEALRRASTPADDWHKAHQGELLSLAAFVWECHDDCHCSEPQIVAWFRNKTDPRFRVPRQLWAGEFRTDGGEWDAVLELAAKREQVAADEPDVAAMIKW